MLLTHVAPHQIRPAPDRGGVFASGYLASDCLTGLGTFEQRMPVPLDIDKLMARADNRSA